MFDLKKFIALIANENRLMQLFYDKAEAAGLDPKFDIYHVLAGDEKPTEKEMEVMKSIFEFNIKGTQYEKLYINADSEFQRRTKEKNSSRSNLKNNNRHLNN